MQLSKFRTVSKKMNVIRLRALFEPVADKDKDNVTDGLTVNKFSIDRQPIFKNSAALINIDSSDYGTSRRQYM